MPTAQIRQADEQAEAARWPRPGRRPTNCVEAGRAEQAELVVGGQRPAGGGGRGGPGRPSRPGTEAEQVRGEAEAYAGKLTGDARTLRHQHLTELVGTLQRLLATAENGRDALQPRRLGGMASRRRPEHRFRRCPRAQVT